MHANPVVQQQYGRASGLGLQAIGLGRVGGESYRARNLIGHIAGSRHRKGIGRTHSLRRIKLRDGKVCLGRLVVGAHLPVRMELRTRQGAGEVEARILALELDFGS